MDETPNNRSGHQPARDGDAPSPYEAMDEQALTQAFLDRDWTCDDLRDAAALWRRASASTELYQRLRDYDALRRSLREAGHAQDQDTDETEPTGGTGDSGGVGDVGDVEGFGYRLAEAIVAGPQDAPAKAEAGGRPRLRRPLALAAAVLLGGVLGASVLWLAGLNTAPGTTAPTSRMAQHETPQTATSDTLSADEAVQYSQAFREITASLDGRAGWMELSDDVGEVGTVAQPLGAPDRVLVLRLAVWRDGERVARSDVVSRPNQSARLTAVLDGRGGQPLRVRYALSLGADAEAPVSIWMGIEADDASNPPDDGVSPSLASLAITQTLPVSAPKSLGTLTTDHGQFRLTASLVPVEAPKTSAEKGLL